MRRSVQWTKGSWTTRMRPPADCLWCIGWPIVYLSLCLVCWLVASLVNNSVDINKVFVDVCYHLGLLCELAVDPWD